MEQNTLMTYKNIRLCKIKITVIEMMRDRGYEIPANEEEFLELAIRNPNKKLIDDIAEIKKTNGSNENISQYIKNFNEHVLQSQTQLYRDMITQYLSTVDDDPSQFRVALNQCYTHPKTQDKCCLYFATPGDGKSSLGKEVFMNFIAYLEESESQHGILITPVDLSTFVQGSLNDYPSYNLEIFRELELTSNPTDNRLVPKHRALSAEESTDLLKRNKTLNVNDMPILLATDIICRYYKFEVGQIIEIFRTEEINVPVRRYVIYRRVALH